MLNAGLDGQLVDTDAPVEFVFDAEGEAVYVAEDEVDVFEGAAEVGVVVWGAVM